jgi:hypothetical protein
VCVCVYFRVCACVYVCAEYSRMSVMSNSSEGSLSNPLEDSDAGLPPDQRLVNQQLRGRKVCIVCATVCVFSIIFVHVVCIILYRVCVCVCVCVDFS